MDGDLVEMQVDVAHGELERAAARDFELKGLHPHARRELGMTLEFDPPAGHDASSSPVGAPSGKTRRARSENMLSTVSLRRSKPARASAISGQLEPSMSILTIGPKCSVITILGMAVPLPALRAGASGPRKIRRRLA